MAKDSRIKSLEDIVMQLGYNPSNIEVVEALVRKKNADIAALRRQLKMPVTKDPMAKEIEENETQKVEMLQFIIEKIEELNKMESEMEKMIKER